MPCALTWRSAATARRDVSGAIPACSVYEHSVYDRLGIPLCAIVVVAAWSSPWNPGASQVEGGCLVRQSQPTPVRPARRGEMGGTAGRYHEQPKCGLQASLRPSPALVANETKTCASGLSRFSAECHVPARDGKFCQ